MFDKDATFHKCTNGETRPYSVVVCSLCMGKGEDFNAYKRIVELEERYKDYEKLWELADQNNCDGDCDLNLPYKRCPECAAGCKLNELAEIRSEY